MSHIILLITRINGTIKPGTGSSTMSFSSFINWTLIISWIYQNLAIFDILYIFDHDRLDIHCRDILYKILVNLSLKYFGDNRLYCLQWINLLGILNPLWRILLLRHILLLLLILWNLCRWLLKTLNLRHHTLSWRSHLHALILINWLIIVILVLHRHLFLSIVGILIHAILI